MIKYHLLLALVLLLFISWANAQTIEYSTEWETHLYTQVEKTVDLPWFWDYQDLLASYAYNTCKAKFEETPRKTKYNYYRTNKKTGAKIKYVADGTCEWLVRTWNSENGWRKWNAINDTNTDWTHDWWLCQLNSNYHIKFLKSKRFKNPLSQLDYCLQVWVDWANKSTMPRYGHEVRKKRDKGIVFIDWVKTEETIQLQDPTSTIPDDTKPYSEPAKPNCHWFKTVEEWKTVQVDLHWGKWFLRILLEFFVWKDEKATIYICDKRK